MSLRSVHLSTSLLALLLAVSLLAAPSAGADEWNQVFEQPKYFEVVQSVHLRSSPSNNSSIIATLKPGMPLQGTAIENGWHKVRTADGKTGYVFKRFLNSSPDAAASFDGSAPAAPAAPETESPAGAPVTPEPALPVPDEDPLVAPEPTPSPDQTPAEDPLVTPEPVQEPAPAIAPADGSVIHTEPIPEPPPPGAEPRELPALDPQVTEGAECKRIKFQPGAISGSVDRSLSAGGAHCYQLGVSQNQWMEVWLTSATDNAVFQIFSPSGASITAEETHWLGRTDAAGDFIIIVSSMDGKDSAYSLKIQIK